MQFETCMELAVVATYILERFISVYYI